MGIIELDKLSSTVIRQSISSSNFSDEGAFTESVSLDTELLSASMQESEKQQKKVVNATAWKYDVKFVIEG